MDPIIFLNIEQVRARWGGAHRSTVYRDIKAGRLPEPVKLGSRTMFLESEIDAAVQRVVDARKHPEAVAA